MHQRLVNQSSRRRSVRARRAERPSLAIALARSLALALFVALALLAQVARGQSTPPTATSSTAASTETRERTLL